MQRIGDLTASPQLRSNFSLAAKWAKVLTSVQLEADPQYAAEMAAVAAAYSEDNRPSQRDPKEWNLERRMEEVECIMRSACLNGVFKEFSIDWEDEPL